MLEQIEDIHAKHADTFIVLQVSEINLISPAQLNEIKHFIHGKNIKIIGTQNAQSQINTRFKLDDSDFLIISLTLEKKKSFYQELINWMSEKYNVPLYIATKTLQGLYFENLVANPDCPVTPRQLGHFSKKLMQLIQEKGFDYAVSHAHIVFNQVFFQHLRHLQITPFNLPKPKDPPKAEPKAQLKTESKLRLVTKQIVMGPGHYRWSAADTTPVNIWQGDRSLFLNYAEPYDLSLGSHNASHPDALRLTTTIGPYQTIPIPAITGSKKGVISYTTGPNDFIFNKRDKQIFNNHSDPTQVIISYYDPFPLYTDIRDTLTSKSIPQATLEESMHSDALTPEENALLSRFIYRKTGTQTYTKKALLTALGLPNQATYSEKELLSCIYDYFAEFREEAVPVELVTGHDLYDSLTSQKGVCRHQAELGRLVFLALGIPVEKMISPNHEGDPFHDYLVITLNGTSIIMDFFYTSKSKIQTEPLKEPLSLLPSGSPSEHHPEHFPLAQSDADEELVLSDAHPFGRKIPYRTREPIKATPSTTEKLFITAMLFLLGIHSLYRIQQYRLTHLQRNSNPQLTRRMKAAHSLFNMTILTLLSLAMGYTLLSLLAYSNATTSGTPNTKHLTLKDLLTGSDFDWKTHKTRVTNDVFANRPTQGSELSIEFVDATADLAAFGTPVYAGGDIIGYRVQKEIPTKGQCNGITLHPKDLRPEQQHDMYIFTDQGLSRLEDSPPGSGALIHGEGKNRLRALELTKELSTRLEVPFDYEEELTWLKQRHHGYLRGSNTE